MEQFMNEYPKSLNVLAAEFTPESKKERNVLGFPQ
jgi:hypothetical protein